LNHQAVEYQNALETVLGEIVGRTDVLVLIGNVSPDDLQSIDAGLRNQFIVLLGGDDEQPYPSDKVGQSTGTPFSENGQILEAHAHWSGYIRVDLQIELSTGQFVEGEYQFFQNQYSRSADEVLAQQQRDPQVQQTIDIVQRWHEDLRATDDDYARNVLQDASYVNSPIAQINNVTYGRDIVRGWYDIYEQTDIAVFNTGGFRGCLDPGPVYISDVRGILPFDNSLELLEVRGAILRSLYHTQSALIIEGIQESNGEIQIIKRDGAIEQLQDDGSYLVLTNTFLAKGGDGVPFKEEQRVETLASDWKVAAMEWFMAHEQQSN
jgi:2',3'-cyclic-nucleotide 2'-phosphodiesterase (5'-nucleotidase family)